MTSSGMEPAACRFVCSALITTAPRATICGPTYIIIRHEHARDLSAVQ
jgi:hypothetical protein